jgi:hypothetical protein
MASAEVSGLPHGSFGMHGTSELRVLIASIRLLHALRQAFIQTKMRIKYFIVFFCQKYSCIHAGKMSEACGARFCAICTTWCGRHGDATGQKVSLTPN